MHEPITNFVISKSPVCRQLCSEFSSVVLIYFLPSVALLEEEAEAEALLDALLPELPEPEPPALALPLPEAPALPDEDDPLPLDPPLIPLDEPALTVLPLDEPVIAEPVEPKPN
jgi:hypothetical protein